MALIETCYIGLVCWYNLGLDTVLAFGRMNSVFVLGAATLFPSYALALLSRYLWQRFLPKVAWYLAGFALTFAYALAFWALTLLVSGVSLAYLPAALLPAFLAYLFLVLPLHLVYQRIMREYPLPWYGTAFALCFLGGVVLWAVLLFVFNVFTLA
jgi:hypothetical protein